MAINVKKIVTGPIETNTYLIANESKACLIIDPSSGCGAIFSEIDKQELRPAGILLTHCHFDHVLGIPEFLDRFPELEVYATAGEKALLSDAHYNGSGFLGEPFAYNGPTREVTEGTMTVGGIIIQVIIIPGHSLEGCAYLIEDCCFCGDILFAGSIGRSDLPGGDGELLIGGIKGKLFALPDSIIVCPGHGGRTTIGRERKLNPFLG